MINKKNLHKQTYYMSNFQDLNLVSVVSTDIFITLYFLLLFLLFLQQRNPRYFMPHCV